TPSLALRHRRDHLGERSRSPRGHHPPQLRMENAVQLLTEDECAPTEPYHGQEQPHDQARVEVYLEEELSELHGRVRPISIDIENHSQLRSTYSSTLGRPSTWKPVRLAQPRAVEPWLRL